MSRVTWLRRFAFFGRTAVRAARRGEKVAEESRVDGDGPKVLPVLWLGEKRYWIDLRLQEFRTVDPVLECIGFDSAEGRRLCRLANVVTCPRCGTSVIVSGWMAGKELRCVRCLAEIEAAA